jgi:dTDP-4-dehydrorhamnose 3,5-epimerase
MMIHPTGIEGSWTVDLTRFGDERGWFQEWFKFSRLAEDVGVRFNPVQANVSKSSAGTVRGIHYSIAPKGQGKLVTVMSGAIDDYIIDIRIGSSTFGQWRRVRLDDSQPRAVLLDPHLGHAFQALRDDTIVSYLVTEEYNPEMEMGISPLCPDVSIAWPADLPFVMSDKDSAAPTLSQAANLARLPVLK